MDVKYLMPASQLQKLLAALLGDDSPVAVLLKDIRDSNRNIAARLAGKPQQTPAYFGDAPPMGLTPDLDTYSLELARTCYECVGGKQDDPTRGQKVSRIQVAILDVARETIPREQIKSVMIALLRGDMSSETATDRIMEVINGRR